MAGRRTDPETGREAGPKKRRSRAKVRERGPWRIMVVGDDVGEPHRLVHAWDFKPPRLTEDYPRARQFETAGSARSFMRTWPGPLGRHNWRGAVVLDLDTPTTLDAPMNARSAG